MQIILIQVLTFKRILSAPTKLYIHVENVNLRAQNLMLLCKFTRWSALQHFIEVFEHIGFLVLKIFCSYTNIYENTISEAVKQRRDKIKAIYNRAVWLTLNDTSFGNCSEFTRYFHVNAVFNK